jgi:hypothetical protein
MVVGNERRRKSPFAAGIIPIGIVALIREGVRGQNTKFTVHGKAIPGKIE